MSEHISTSVKSFYDRYTYPNYPLLASPEAKASYHAFSDFAYNLHRVRNKDTIRVLYKKNYKKVLIAGCGDSQPLLMAKGEPKQNLLFGVDLSEKSIKKARVRLKIHTPLRQNIFFRCLDIQTEDLSFRNQSTIAFDHIDCVGVLHHCKEPEVAIRNLANHLEEGATMRVMVYNPFARKFIDEISDDIKERLKGKNVLELTSKDFLDLKTHIKTSRYSEHDRLKYMGSILNHRQRFADTFLHPHAVSFQLTTWFEWFEKYGLKVYGLYDRYRELENHDPFNWPGAENIDYLAREGEFLNNFEIYLVKNPSVAIQNINTKRPLSKDINLLDW